MKSSRRTVLATLVATTLVVPVVNYAASYSNYAEMTNALTRNRFMGASVACYRIVRERGSQPGESRVTLTWLCSPMDVTLCVTDNGQFSCGLDDLARGERMVTFSRDPIVRTYVFSRPL